jgi:hypothetical protein
MPLVEIGAPFIYTLNWFDHNRAEENGGMGLPIPAIRRR